MRIATTYSDRQFHEHFFGSILHQLINFLAKRRINPFYDLVINSGRLNLRVIADEIEFNKI